MLWCWNWCVPAVLPEPKINQSIYIVDWPFYVEEKTIVGSDLVERTLFLKNVFSWNILFWKILYWRSHDLEAFNSGSELGFFEIINFQFGCNITRAFSHAAASILFLSIFRHKIGVLKSPALFQGKELQVTRFQGQGCCLRKLSESPSGFQHI